MYLNANNFKIAESAALNNWVVIGGVGSLRLGSIKNDDFHSLAGDTLSGGLGDDTYNLWDAKSKILEKAGEGIDTAYIRYWGGYALADNVENAVLLSKGATWVTGNALGNVLVAGRSATTMDGGRGNDVLVGGAGADIFKVKAGNGSDAILNFRPGWDMIKLDGYGIKSFDQIKSAASQTGTDVTVRLSSTETLVLRDVQLGTLGATDFNLAMSAVVVAKGNSTFSDANQAWNANGWYVVNNAWGSSALTYGKDYSLSGSYNTVDMTKGTTFNWSYPVATDVPPTILAFPEVIFGASPLNMTGNDPSDTAHVFPVKVSDIVGVTADFDVSFNGHVSGFNVAYDIWLSGTPTGVGTSAVSNEVMVWLHKGDFEAFGDLVGTYTKGEFAAKIYHTGTYTAIVADKDVPKGTIDVGDMLLKLKDLGIVSGSEYLRSIELGAEVVSGAGSLTINDLDLRVETVNANGGTTVKMVSGAGTSVTQTGAVLAPVSTPAIPAVVNATVPALEAIVDAYGYKVGTQTTTTDAAGTMTIAKVNVNGLSLGRDVITRTDKTIVTEHYTGGAAFAGAEKVIQEANGAVLTQHHDAAWNIVGAERATRDASGATVTEHYDAQWKVIGVDRAFTAADGVAHT